jgi:superfamily II DNA or RNA helicase
MLARLESGETLLVSNCGVLCEGWDQPSVKCAILARPTKSTGLYLQQAGRILRPWQGQQAIILDHGGCAVEHGLPQDDREYTLDARPKAKRREGGDLPSPVKVCEACQAVMPLAAGMCEVCGHVFGERELPEEEAGELVEVTTNATGRPTGWQLGFPRVEPSEEYYQSLLQTEPSAAWARARFRVETHEQPPETGT